MGSYTHYCGGYCATSYIWTKIHFADDRKKHATKEDVDRLQMTLQEMSRQLDLQIDFEQPPPPVHESSNLFTEVEKGHKQPVPKRLE